MSAKAILLNLLTLAFLFAGLAVISAWSGDVSWLNVAVMTVVMFVALLLIERFLGEKDRASSDS
jgi:hypothetical protein